MIFRLIRTKKNWRNKALRVLHWLEHLRKTANRTTSVEKKRPLLAFQVEESASCNGRLKSKYEWMRETLGNLYWTTVYNGLTSTAWKNGVALRVDNSTNALKKTIWRMWFPTSRADLNGISSIIVALPNPGTMLDPSKTDTIDKFEDPLVRTSKNEKKKQALTRRIWAIEGSWPQWQPRSGTFSSM